MALKVMEQKIMQYLQEQYRKRGYKNFYFKSTRLPLNIGNRTVGKILKQKIQPSGMIEKWSRGESTHVITWVTCFKKQNIEEG